MKKTAFFILIIFFLIPLLQASDQTFQKSGGGAIPLKPRQAPCLNFSQRLEINKKIAQNIQKLKKEGKISSQKSQNQRLFLNQWPLKYSGDDLGYAAAINYVDHNPAIGQLEDYYCGTRTYDTEPSPGFPEPYNHQGTDYTLWPFAWLMMDKKLVQVVAVAPGTIVYKQDSYGDRECGEPYESIYWNAVYILHDDGTEAWYGHLKKGSVLKKEIGERVQEGEFLGYVGSSGVSLAPHLHLEFRAPSAIIGILGEPIDPYLGPCNPNPMISWGVGSGRQKPYNYSALHKVMTHSADPQFLDCKDIINKKDNFHRGDRLYIAGYYRDLLAGQLSQYRVYRPDGSLFWAWDFTLDKSESEYYGAAYRYNAMILPSDVPYGQWRLELTYEGRTAIHIFNVLPQGQCPPEVTLQTNIDFTSILIFDNDGVPPLDANSVTFTFDGVDKTSQFLDYYLSSAQVEIIRSGDGKTLEIIDHKDRTDRHMVFSIRDEKGLMGSDENFKK